MCHKVCKSIYTHKRYGQLNVGKRTKGEDNDPKSSKATDFQNCCFICGKDRDGKGIRDMYSVSTKAKSDAIYDKASELQEVSALSNITYTHYCKINLAARKYRYHRACMDRFMIKQMQGG